MKLPLIALCLLSFILINAAEAKSYKEYCDGREFFPNGEKYPHLHCGNGFFTLSYSKKDKVNFITSGGIQCDRVRKVLDAGHINKYPEIRARIEAFNRDYCGGITVASNKNREWLVEEYPVFEDNSNRKEYVYNQEYNEEQGYEFFFFIRKIQSLENRYYRIFVIRKLVKNNINTY
uniref:Uncharacterized protein n=1 Tax=Amphimedon queenslandica TaxID=400682 RepID=A0A1X7U3P4_AMPQE